MEIEKWFENGCNYHEGVTIYASLKEHSANLLRLFLRKQNTANIEKLKYELGKLRNPTNTKITPPVIKENKQKLKIPPLSTSLELDPKLAKSHTNSFYKLNQLHPDLHQLAIKQRNDFQTAISLHSQLTRLHASEEGLALKFCIQIEDLFDAIETTQKVLKHYVTHKVALNITSRSYKDYTGGQLADARRNKRTSVTKFKNKVSLLKSKLEQNLSKSEATKVKVALEKSENKLLHHEMELQQLNDLINKK
ncbi:hypothetical protein [Algibacter sp. PT7-4]|uniref:hypothetical protein n=1 Tax=Algibacter ulvanivorans TaxID=3400999 RepID=UPI003AAD15AF